MTIISNYINNQYKYHTKLKQDKNSRILYKFYITDSNIVKIFCENLYKNFRFPYGHSKTARYFEALGLKIPYKIVDETLKDFNVIIPGYEIDGGKNGLSGKQLWVWGNAMLDSEIHYKNMLELGATQQIARSVLPNSLKTEIVITANLREWRTILKQRTAKVAHPQIREVMIPLLEELKSLIPIVFDDIEVEG